MVEPSPEPCTSPSVVVINRKLPVELDTRGKAQAGCLVVRLSLCFDQLLHQVLLESGDQRFHNRWPPWIFVCLTSPSDIIAGSSTI